jgi:uncharacterized protein YbbK (DUF523 family)
MTVLVSACLLGFPCRHDGKDRRDARVLEAVKEAEVVPVCPEMAGGLGTPRPASWRDGSAVRDAQGHDVTEAFQRGAQAAVTAARVHFVQFAILKQNSPSCGTRMTGTALGRAPGLGVAAQALREAGVATKGEDEL